MVTSSAGGTLYGCRVTRLEKWCIIANEAPECLSTAGRISHWHHIFLLLSLETYFYVIILKYKYEMLYI